MARRQGSALILFGWPTNRDGYSRVARQLFRQHRKELQKNGHGGRIGPKRLDHSLHGIIPLGELQCKPRDRQTQLGYYGPRTRVIRLQSCDQSISQREEIRSIDLI